MSALNSTLDCESQFLESVIQLEQFHWQESNLTSGCTPSCRSDLDDWVSNVKSACSNGEMKEMGNIIRPWSLPMIYQHRFGLGCMRSGSSWCWLESLEWEGSDVMRWDEEMCATGDPDFDADICFEEGFDMYEVLPEDRRLSNLYEKDLVCSDCFLKILNHRLSSPDLEKSNYTDYMIGEHSALEEFCSTSLPLTTANTALFVRTMPMPTPTTSTSGGSSPAETTCAGQLIEPTDDQVWCDGLTEKYKVPTGDLIVLTGDWSCRLTDSICAPAQCPLRYIGWDQEWTCESLRALISTDERNVTEAEFSSWNRRLVGTCDAVRGDQYICEGPPGGVYEFPPPVHAPTQTSYYTTATPALPTHSGTTQDCGKFYDVSAGDTCEGIAFQETIRLDDFLELNPQIWSNCTNLWLGYSYCVAPVSDPPVSNDGSCGPDHNFAVCAGSGQGSCCSNQGKCGDGDDFCHPDNCYSGACGESQENISENGSCGPDNSGWLCGGESVWGKCCSIYGWCGNSDQHCGPGFCLESVILISGARQWTAHADPLFQETKSAKEQSLEAVAVSMDTVEMAQTTAVETYVNPATVKIS
ncbi:LysM domain-containing protein [Paramyrothecium foliicola]|nr:LysM domain-containing protein [Paramyrothecium foliicola]